MKPDFASAVRLDEQPMPEPTEMRLRSRLGGSTTQRALWWRLPVIAVVSAGLGAGVVAAFWPTAVTDVGGFHVEQASASFQSQVDGEQLTIRGGAVTLADAASGSSMRVEQPSVVRREARGLRVVRGQVELTVQKRKPGAEPMRVLVSDGEIEVRGTRFLIEQRESGGVVTLHEGHIVFRANSGKEVELQPGQQLQWPLPELPVAQPAPTVVDESVKPDEEPPAEVPKPRNDAEWAAHDRLLRAHTLLERMPKLRAEGKHAQAAAELEVAMKQDLPASARERLSYELIDLLANELWENERACRQAKDHLWRYPAGKFDDEIQQLRVRLNCR